MGEEAVAADAEQLRIGRLELGEVVGQTLVLTLTDRAPVQPAIATSITTQVELVDRTAGERDDFNARFQQGVKAFIAKL